MSILSLRLPSEETAGLSPPRSQARHWLRTLGRGALVLVLLSVAWRTLRWLLQFPIWGDEAYLALNFLDRDYLGLTRPLRCVQVAPVLFLWGELTAYRLLGGGELALRLLPYLAGLATLPLFWRLARLTLPPGARYGAIGLFAVSYYPVRHSCEVKPYAVDLLVALALLVVALTWLRRPDRLRWLAGLVVLVPIGLAASYPAVFVAGAVSVVLLPTVCRQRWPARLLFAAYNVLMVAGFLVPYLLAGLGQFESTGGTHNDYWAEWFAPRTPLPFLLWLVKAHTGNMLAYPLGGPRGASTLSFLLCLAGAWRLGRSGRWQRLALLGLPFALTLLAAVLHRYPYGGSARIAQHLTPAICLLAGAGLADLVGRMAHAAARRRAAVVAWGVFAVVGLGALGRDLLRPYKTTGDREVRRLLAEVVAQARPEDQVLALPPNQDLWPTVEWYLRQQPGRVTFEGQLDAARLARGGGIWALCFGGDTTLAEGLAARLRATPRQADRSAAEEAEPPALPLVLVRDESYVLQCGQIEGTIVRCQVLHWAAPQGSQGVRSQKPRRGGS